MTDPSKEVKRWFSENCPAAEIMVLASDYDRVCAERDAEWRPIESAPKDGTFIQAFERGTFKGATEIKTLRWSGLCDRWENEGMSGYEPTHWRPLPSPPSPSEAPHD